MSRVCCMSRVLPILFNTEMVQAILNDHKTATRRLIKPQPKNHQTYKLGICTDGAGQDIGKFGFGSNKEGGDILCVCPPYRPGDILYVRECWAFWPCIECMEGESCNKTPTTHEDREAASEGCYIYRADHPHPERITWRPSIHMPKAAARIWLKVTDVRVERLRDITEEQAIKEGISRLYDDLSDAEYIDWTKRTGIYPKSKADWRYKNYLWHGDFGACGTGNKLSDAWEYQYSSYDSAIDSFSSLWNTTVPLKDWNIYGWNANPWVWVIEFERCERPESEER